MNRNDLKEIITAVIEKMSNDAPAAACGTFHMDEPVITTYYAIGEEDPTPRPTRPPKPTATPIPTMTTRYAIGEEDGGVTTLYAVGEEG